MSRRRARRKSPAARSRTERRSATRRPPRWRFVGTAGVLVVAIVAGAILYRVRTQDGAGTPTPDAGGGALAVFFDSDGVLVGELDPEKLARSLTSRGLPAPSSPLGPVEAGIAEELASALAAVAVSPVGDSYGRLGQILDSIYCQDVARACYAAAQRLAPEDHRWPHYLGILEEAAGNAKEAERQLRRAIQLRPDFVPSRGRLAWLLLRANDLDEAGQTLRGVARDDPSLAYPYTGLARIARRQGRNDDAERLLAQALERDPADLEAHALLSRLCAARGDRDAARRHARRAGPAREPSALFRDSLIQERARVSGALLNHRLRAQRQFDEGRIDEMIVTLQYVVGRDSSHVDTMLDLATALESVGRREEADEVLERARARHPDHAAVHEVSGRIALARGDAASALRWLDRAVQSDPRHARAHVTRTIALASLGRAAEAARSAREAVDLDPGDAATVARLAQVLGRIGRRDDARSILATGIAASPDAAVLRTTLEQLQAKREQSK